MRRFLTSSVLAFTLCAAAPARADVLLTPFLGVTFGGDTENQQVNYGVSLAFLGGGVFGVEFDASFTPNFFDTDDDVVLIDDSNVTTVMGNLMLSTPAAPLRVYGSAGAGLIRARATSVGNVFDLDDNSFGVNFGGGLIGQFNDNVGIRGDLRYFRSIQDFDVDDDFELDLASFDFWRATAGLLIRF